MKRRKTIQGLSVYTCGLLAAALLCLAGHKTEALAAEDNFAVEAKMLPGGGDAIYEVSLTIQNNGSDWEGTARFMVEDSYRTPCAYDTDLALPQGSKKQFTVKVPVNSINETRGTAYVLLLDRDDKVTAKKEFARLLQDDTEALHMGILSDAYSSLTYLDMGGEELFFYGDNYPVKLEELRQDDLADRLDGLTMLVIDDYSTEVLTDEDKEAMWDWVDAGGVLIIGTGSHAEETLGGFDRDELDMELIKVHPPTGQADDDKNLDYYNAVDIGRLSMAELQLRTSDFQEIYYSESLRFYQASQGDGAVSVLPYALTEIGSLEASAFGDGGQTEYVCSMLDTVCSGANMRYSSSGDRYDVEYSMTRLFGVLGGSDISLKFGVLKVIVVVYVFLVGPVLYLVLKCLKKRELYWLAVPASALLGIGVVYLAGIGFEVRETRVCSVILDGLSGKAEREAYLQCYDAKHSEWQLKLADGYGYIGPMTNDSYYYEDDLKYYHHVQRDGSGLHFGIKPSASFENCYFQAGGAKARQDLGAVDISSVESDWAGLSGTVVNRTDRDFPYFTVIANGIMYVYEGLPAGESRELDKMEPVYEGEPIYAGYNSYIYDLRSSAGKGEKEREDAAAQAALGIGICASARRAGEAEVFFMGVTRDYEKAVDDVCREVSYGCLYTVR